MSHHTTTHSLMHTNAQGKHPEIKGQVVDRSCETTGLPECCPHLVDSLHLSLPTTFLQPNRLSLKFFFNKCLMRNMWLKTQHMKTGLCNASFLQSSVP